MRSFISCHAESQSLALEKIACSHNDKTEKKGGDARD